MTDTKGIKTFPSIAIAIDEIKQLVGECKESSVILYGIKGNLNPDFCQQMAAKLGLKVIVIDHDMTPDFYLCAYGVLVVTSDYMLHIDNFKRMTPHEILQAANSKDIETMSERIAGEVVQERKRQNQKWGGAEHDDQHSVQEFVQLIEDYAGWARVMAGMDDLDKARERLIQVAALAVAAAEGIDRLKLGYTRS